MSKEITMDKIASFTIDHDVLDKGMYVSRIDGDITTYDLRFIKPNTPPFLGQKTLHTIEHLMATYARNGEYAANVVYFGPMGCRTGFYLIVRDLAGKESIRLVLDAIEKSIAHTGAVPGAEKAECGNYLEHDLEGAREALRDYYNVVKEWTIFKLQYKK